MRKKKGRKETKRNKKEYQQSKFRKVKQESKKENFCFHFLIFF